MTKNLAVVLLMLFFSSAVFAGTPAKYKKTAVNLDQLAVAAVFSQYPNANLVPAKAKTLAHIKYNAVPAPTGPIMGGTGGAGWPMPYWVERSVPAVFVPTLGIAVPASELRGAPQSNGFQFYVSLNIISNGNRKTKTARFYSSETKCPKGFMYRKATNDQETDICIQNLNDQFWLYDILKKEVFSKYNINYAVAAKVLKK